jgi:hypothetical protein
MTLLLCLLLAGTPAKGAPDGGTRAGAAPAAAAKAPGAKKTPSKEAGKAHDAANDTTPSALEQRALDQAWDQMRAQLADAGTPNPPFHWKVSNILEDIEMPGIVMANGFPVKMHAFRVKATEQEVFAELLQNFQDQGLYLEPPEKQAQPVKQNQVTALDYQRFISYTAFVEPHPDGTCTVMLGEANIAEGLDMRSRGGEADFAPLYPGAQAVMRTRAEGMDTLGYRTAASEADLLAFYKKNLEAQGYAAAPGNAWQKPGDHIRVVARHYQGMLQVMLIRSRGELAPPAPKP